MLETEKMLDSLVNQGWYAQENTFGIDFVQPLKKHVSNRCLRSATVGQKKVLHQEIRSDEICWLEKDDSSVYVQEYMKFMKMLKNEVNRSLYLGIRDDEMHYAKYSKGGFYKPHLDNFKGSNKRVLTVITYLNENWQESDGGCLNLIGESNTIVQPKAGTSVIFMSEKILHEVLPSNNTRESITGWMLKQ